MRSKTQIYAIYSMLLVIVFASTALFFLSVFQCKPISHFVCCQRHHPLLYPTDTTQWNLESPGKCISPNITLSMAYLHSSIIASSDFGFTIMPIFVVSHGEYMISNIVLTNQGLASSNGSIYKDISMQPYGSRCSVSPSILGLLYPHSYHLAPASRPSCASHISRIW